MFHRKPRTIVDRREFLIAGAAALGGAGAGLAGGYLLFKSDPSDRRLFGISMTGSDPASVGVAQRVGTALDRPPQVMNFFVAWEWRAPFPSATVEAIRLTGAIPEITWEPWDPRNGAVQPAYALENLAAYDEYVDTFAQGCAAWGHELNIRFAHEMNSDWYPWSVFVNNGTPQAYTAAHHRVRERFIAAGATNVRWVWCPNIVYQDRPDLIVDSYPGDDVVDIVALDGYNRGGRTPQDLFSQSLDVLNHVAADKPVWINEVGCTPMQQKAQWVADMFTYLESTPVACLVWFEVEKANYPDWTLLSNHETADAARRSLATW
jgi:mannan endo-1,4-beta-mannosidase